MVPIHLAGLMSAFIKLFCAGAILYVFWWGLNKSGLGDPMYTILKFLLIILTMGVAINFILAIFGHPVFVFR